MVQAAVCLKRVNEKLIDSIIFTDLVLAVGIKTISQIVRRLVRHIMQNVL